MEKAKVICRSLGDRRVLAVSDIHGSLSLLRKLFEKLSYQPGEDALVILGDLVQKGPENLATLQYVMELSKMPYVYVLLGNNDDFAVNGRDEHIYSHTVRFRENSLLGEMLLKMGEKLPESVEETAALREKARKAFPEEYAFLQGLPHILETERYLFAHAGLQNEDLDHQDLDFVLAEPEFIKSVKHVFSKMLLVGHWPTANFWEDRLSNAPFFDSAHNVLAIDGGNRIKMIGQLNGVILNSSNGSWSWTGVDEFSKIKAPCSQDPVPGEVVNWPQNHVELLQKGKCLSRCRGKRSGAEMDVPNSFLYEDEEGLRTSSITDARLQVEAGEEVALIEDCGDRLLVMKNGETGWLLKRA